VDLRKTVYLAVVTLDELVDQYYDRLFRSALFLCGDRKVAEDLVQETFLAAGESIDRFEERSSPYTWLYGIFRNKFRSWLRKKDRAVSLQHLGQAGNGDGSEFTLEDEERGPEEELARQEEGELVQEVVDELPDHHRRVLVLRYVEEYSYQEIADALDCSIGTVKSRIHYALKKVGRKLRKQHGIDGT
jgi:RNA polymerase sigma-70 factor (ECF subfamily)